MSERYSANIRIGGQITPKRIPTLLEAIRTASVSHEWGDAPFEPNSAEELLAAVRDGHLFLCDEQSRYGEFPELEATCQKLGLSYSRWAEGYCAYDAELVDWRTGMKEPVVRVASNSSDATYVATEDVRKALKHLDAGNVARAKRLLQRLCPDIPALPPFEIVQEKAR
jgi:hypothetical protein